MREHPLRRLMPAPVLVAVGLVLAGCGAPAPADLPSTSATITLDIDGADRDLLLRAPERGESERLPVVIALHGLGSSAAELESLVGLTGRSEEDRFIAVYPSGTLYEDGVTRGWNAGECCNVLDAPEVDDIAFLRAMLDVLPQYGGDPDEVYLAGFSNGGMFAYRAACDLGDEIAGIAVVAGAYNVSDCASAEKMPVIVIHGRKDDFIPYEGGDSPPSITEWLEPFVNPSVQDAVDVWLDRNGCDDSGETSETDFIEEVQYTGCDAGSSVDVYTVTDGFHQWPDAGEGFEATDVILSTFLD